MMPGKQNRSKRDVVSFIERDLHIKKVWLLDLNCGHVVVRRVRYRWSPMIDAYGKHKNTRFKDPSPTWVYCEKCQEQLNNKD